MSILVILLITMIYLLAGVGFLIALEIDIEEVPIPVYISCLLFWPIVFIVAITFAYFK